MTLVHQRPVLVVPIKEYVGLRHHEQTQRRRAKHQPRVLAVHTFAKTRNPPPFEIPFPDLRVGEGVALKSVPARQRHCEYGRPLGKRPVLRAVYTLRVESRKFVDPTIPDASHLF